MENGEFWEGKYQDQAEINKAENSLKDKIRSTACKMLVGESPEDTGKTIQKWTEQVLGECIPEDLKEKLQTDKGGEEIVEDAKKLQDLKNKFKGNGG